MKNVVLLLIVFCTFATGYCVAQQKQEVPTVLAGVDILAGEKEIVKEYGTLPDKEPEITESATRILLKEHAVSALYMKEAATAGGTKDGIRAFLSEYLISRHRSQSAAQASQGSGEALVHLQILQVAQNARIITLLEKLTASK